MTPGRIGERTKVMETAMQHVAPRARSQRMAILRASGLVWALFLLCIVATVLSPAFLNSFNLINIARQIALFGIVSIAMTFIILTAGIDLSVGSIVGVTAVVSALLLKSGVPIPLVLLAGLAVGLPAAWIAGRLASRILSPLLYQVTSTYPITIAVAIGLLVLVTMGAALLPARRAARIDPMMALRME